MKPEKAFPFVLQPLSEEDEKEYADYFKAFPNVYYVGPKKYLLPKKIKEQGPIFYNFEARSTDIWLFGYPRSGTTLTQEMTYLLATDLNYQEANKTILDLRFPLLEHTLFRDEVDRDEYLKRAKGTSLDESFIYQLTTSAHKYLNETKERRFIKTHLAFSLLSPSILTSGCKIIYVARNPKDVLLSMYRYGTMEGNQNNIRRHWQFFKRNLVIFTPYFENLKEGWALRNHKNVLFIFYEDIIKDIRSVILRMANFLEKKLSVEQIEKLESHLNINNFKNNKSVNNDHLVELGLYQKSEEHSFIWKGKIGGWKEHFEPKLQKELDDWISKNLKGTDIEFPN